MKTMAKTLIMMFFVGLIGSSCSTVSRLNADYDAKVAADQKLTEEQKKEQERAQHESQLPGSPLPRHP